MNSLIPIWIIGGPAIAILIMSFAFKGSSSMGGSLPRRLPREREIGIDPSAPLFDPMVPDAPRRIP
jgi:hypothetical protein